MGEFTEPKVIISLAQYEQLMEDSKCEIESSRLKDLYSDFIGNFLQVSGNSLNLISEYNANELGLYFIVRTPEGEIEIKSKY